MASPDPAPTKRSPSGEEVSITSPEWLDQLYSLPRFVSKPGLSRFESLCRPLFDEPWWRELDAIKVTGSNGKGTVSLLTSAILEAAGFSTGTYTSPHLRRFVERIQLGTTEVDAKTLDRAWSWLAPRIAAAPEIPLAFEAMTALGLRVFSQARPRALVAEVGIGGRHDPVRRIPGRLAVLVSLDLEHTRLLGSTLEAIAEDKADLAESGGELLVGQVGSSLLGHLRQHAARRGVEVTALAEVARWSGPVRGRRGMRVDLEVDDLRLEALDLGLLGAHQVENAALAVLAAKRWIDRRSPGDLDLLGNLETAVRRAVAAPRIPGRLERIASDPEVWIDIGHTLAAVRAVGETARWAFGDRPLLLVLGVSHDKDARGIAEVLAPVAERVICTRAHHRGGEVERVAASVAALGKPYQTVEPLSAAMELAVDAARRDGMVVLVAGGLFLAIEAAEILAGRDPQALRFY